MNAWLPQASYPCGNFSDTSNLNLLGFKGSLGPAFTLVLLIIVTRQIHFCPYTLPDVSVISECIFGQLCYIITVVPPQPNSLSGVVY